MKIRQLAPALALSVLATAPLSAQNDTGAPFIEQMTWTEIRDAMAAGTTKVIVPIGGTEQNGPHMVMGKHNYVVTFAAREMARRIGGALVAPTVAWVPEGSYEREGFGDKPGVITNPSPSYNRLLEAAARSLEAHGFTEIIFIADSGGDQPGMDEVAGRLNAEWEGGATKIFSLTDYYQKGQEYSRAWLMAEYGYDMETIGSHAGITDTSAVMYVFADGVRNDRRYRFGGRPDAGVTGDPTLATREIGRMVVNFKIVGAIQQYDAMKAPPRRGRGRGGN